MNKFVKFFCGKGSSIAYGGISVIFTIVPESFFSLFKIDDTWSDARSICINRCIVAVVMIIVANFSYWCYINRRKIVSLIESNFSIQIEYGDIFEILGGKKVIPFDECFTTKVGSMPSEIKQDSVCGQYLSKHPITDDEIQMLIGKMEVKPAETPSKFGGQTRFESGTLLPREDYLLMAFVKLDQNGLGHLTYEEYLDSLDMLWEQIDRHYGTSDVYVPILGSRITRFDQELTQQQLLDIMISSYRLSPKKIKTPCKLHIVCRGRDGFSLNNVFGIN